MMRFVRCDTAVHFTESIPPPARHAGAPSGGPARSGSAPTLLFVHALGTSHRIYDGVVEALAWPGPVLRYDLRGHGLSEVGEQPYTIASLARDASQLLDRLGVAEVVVCGLSVGGLIAQQLALSERRVRAAILCGTAARIGTAAGWRARIEQLRAGGLAGQSEVVLARWFGPDFRAREPELVSGCRCLLERTSEAGYRAMLEALADADLSERTRDIRVPTLVVSGEIDEATTASDGQRLAASIPGARFALLRGASHLLCVEQPRELAALIQAFAGELGLG